MWERLRIQDRIFTRWVTKGNGNRLDKKKLPGSGSGRKQDQEKKKRRNSKVEEVDARVKKFVGKASNKRKSKIITEFDNFQSYNRFTVLTNEDLTEDLTWNRLSSSIKVTEKSVDKKRKARKNKNKVEIKIGSVDKVSSEGIYPEVVRCKHCFRSHFPSRKACKFNLNKEGKENKMGKLAKVTEILDNETMQILQNYIRYLESGSPENKMIRLRGGAGNSPLIITRAIDSAKRHGISLIQGVLNEADGNCAFDAVINNINYRECFNEKLSLSSNIYRQIWVTELESEASRYPALGAGYTKEEMEENWNLLKQSGVYEVDFFGDLVLHAIARGCNKNILIFNTNVEAADPIYVVEASHFGGFIDDEIPVVVAYNQVHYESLHPVTQHDIDQTKMLVNSYISGNYQYKKKDIPFLISTSSGEKVDTEYVNVENKDQYDIAFPPLSRVIAKNVHHKEETILEECLLTIDKLKEIKQKDMTKAQMKRFKSLLYLEKKSKLTTEQKKEYNTRSKYKMQETRSEETPEEKMLINKKIKEKCRKQDWTKQKKRKC